jgi:hypothetical protein
MEWVQGWGAMPYLLAGLIKKTPIDWFDWGFLYLAAWESFIIDSAQSIACLLLA